MIRVKGPIPSHVDPSKIPPRLGVLIKSIFVKHNGKWKYFAMFGSTEYEITTSKNTALPEHLNPTAHPGRIVSIRSDLLRDNVIHLQIWPG